MRRKVVVLGALTACAAIALASLPDERRADEETALTVPTPAERRESKPLLVQDQSKVRTAVKAQKKSVQPLATLSDAGAQRSLVELDASNTTAWPSTGFPGS